MVANKEKIRGKKVLVTGGLGFVGHNIVKTLVNDWQCDVTVVDNCLNSSPAVLGGTLQKIKLIQASVLDDNFYSLIDEAEYLFHLACVQIAHSGKDPVMDLRVNAESTLRMPPPPLTCRSMKPGASTVPGGMTSVGQSATP